MFRQIDGLPIAQNSERGHDDQRQFTANIQRPAKMVLSGNMATNWKWFIRNFSKAC